MKLLIKQKSVQIFGQGLIVSALLSSGVAYAADSSSQGLEPTTKGAGASELSGNSENEAGEHSSQAEAAHPKDAKSFVREALEGNSAEIALAEVAERKAQNPEVKQLAQTIRQDHRQANEKLQPIAQSHGISVNQPLESKHQKKLERFQKLSGSQFDQEYAKDMLKDHVKDISEYQRATQQIQQQDVKQYAQETLPTLRKHLQQAEAAALSAGVDQSTITSLTKGRSSAVGGTGESEEQESGTVKPYQAPQSPKSTP
ncbi:MAG: DUF4142 domain-containing protein [Verrucomicrobiota bacterium]